MHKNQIRRRRATALALFGLSIALLTIYFGEPASGGLHAVQRGAMEVLSPVQRVASGAFTPVSNLVGWIGDSFDAKSQNKKLKNQLLDARLTAARLATADAQNAQLRKLANFDSSDSFPTGYKSIGARVIVRSPNAWFARVTIDKGSGAGLRVDDPVVSGDGLIGRVTAVAGDAAQVTLITDPDSSVAALVPTRRILGIVDVPSGNQATSNDLQLDFIRQHGTLMAGDMVVTAGTVGDPTQVASIYPPGIPIGQITKVDTEERNLYDRVHMRSFADMRDLQLVQVLKKK